MPLFQNTPTNLAPSPLKLLLKLQSFTDWEEDREPERVPDHEAKGKQWNIHGAKKSLRESQRLRYSEALWFYRVAQPYV